MKKDTPPKSATAKPTKVKSTVTKSTKTRHPTAKTPTADAATPTPKARVLKAVPRPKAAPQPSVERIAVRAYEIFLSRDRQHGHDLADWLQAEAELSTPKRATKAKAS